MVFGPNHLYCFISSVPNIYDYQGIWLEHRTVDRNIYWHLKGVRSDLIYPAGLIFENEEPIGFITLD